MKTKPKNFDAVAASRQWREDAGRMLDAMPMAGRIAFLEGLRAPAADRKPNAASAPAEGAVAVREDTTPYTAQPGKEETP
ncbi:MAG: hypothetical protein NTV46_22210 [Verrucomicrobia bacterium]|nr:hypothetical protein [Verrucomicrobiota bacterium]